MLKREAAEAQLEKLFVDKWIDQRLAKVARLSAPLRASARAVLGHDAKGKSIAWEKLEAARRECRRQLARTSVKDRAKLFETLLGGLAPCVQRGWDMMAHRPYTRDCDRKAFRAPNLADLVNERRVEWLAGLCTVLGGYGNNHDIEWVAAWAAHLPGYDKDGLGLLLAAAIDAGGKTARNVLEILKDSAKGEHEIGAMDQHVTRALLACSDPEGWEFVERLLLAAQRQEGLRQTILETIDEAHPQAFRRMLKLILDNNLARFAATVRAMDVWFGFQWDAISAKKVNEVIEAVLKYLDDPKARQKAIAGDDAEQTFLALWCIAHENAEAAIPAAAKLLKDKREGHRFVAVHLLYMLDLEPAREAAIAALADPDLRIVARALDCLAQSSSSEEPAKKSNTFEQLEKLYQRVPDKKTVLKPIVWPWWTIRISKEEVTSAMHGALEDRPVTRLIPYLEHLPGYLRASVVKQLVEAKKFDAATRKLLLELVTDNNCREEAIEGLKKCRITEEEAGQMENLLTRKSGDVRRGVLGLLEGQKDAAILASADRLLAARDGLQRLAGLELLRRLVESKRLAGDSRARARAYKEQQKKVSKEEMVHLEAILDEQREAASLDDALGLLDATKRTPPADPKKKVVTFCSTAAREILVGLDALIDQHRDEKVFIPNWRTDQDDDEDDEGDLDAEEPAPVSTEQAKGKEELLGNVKWDFPSPRPKLPLEKDLQRLPLREVWERWWRNRPAKLRDKDGLELIRALWLGRQSEEDDDDDDDRVPWLDNMRSAIRGGIKPPKLKYDLVTSVLPWLLRIDPPKGAPGFVLDGLEAVLAMIPRDKLAEQVKDWSGDLSIECRWRGYDSPIDQWRGLMSEHMAARPEQWEPEHWGRLFRLLRWCDEPTGNVSKFPVPRQRPDWEHVLQACRAGAATEADLIDHLLGPRGQTRWSSEDFDELGALTAAKPPKELAELPALADIMHRCRERILQVELKRGDSPTAATEAASDLKCSGGLDALARVLEALGQEKLSRGTRWGDKGKPAIFSHLIRTSIPTGEGDAPEAFALRMNAVGASQGRLIEVAMYAPQWARHVERALDWPGLEDGVWWLHAHTRDRQWNMEPEIRRKWEAAVRQRTPLAGRDLLEGAVDVAWFRRAYDMLGEKRWDELYEAAKYASSAGGHKRAQLFADAMLGRERKPDLVKRILGKRHQDAVRALGLLPLPPTTGAGLSDAAKKDLHERYKVLQEFLRGSRQFGSMRQASEKRATAIGMENLARTAGYPDPVRLQWAMEAEETRDLSRGPLTARVGDIAVTLSIDEDGQPQIAAQNTKSQKTLAAVPSAAKKDPKVAELVARKTDLKRSASRVRHSLEAAMCRGDVFSGAELRELTSNPMLAPLLGRIVFIGEGIAGYPVDGGQGLADFAGTIEPVKKNEALRIAHPVDLLATKQWDRWQHDCFARERVQPFKQIFRELYVPTPGEGGTDGDELSRRYAGHQVNPRQAMALLTSRGWVTAPEEGVFRTFHDIGLTAWLAFQEPFHTPAEVEGLTLEGVRFARRGEWKAIPIKDVPPRIFSEVMRDVDLVVSVAHRGGVDPEASASTVQMRSTLLRETCSLLKLDNVRLAENHVLIEGSLGSYTVHLGSAVTHRQPGGALFIVAVHSQHRGRLFLPFADDDPKTAEVISKVLLLARDMEIQDPSILAQIRA